MSYISGGGGGTPFPLPPGGLFPNWFVNPATGSDSNNGLTSGTPFKTIQHAANIAAKYDYQNIGAPTINLADGTYTTANQGVGFGGVVFSQLHNSPSAQGGYFISGDTATPGNVVINFDTNQIFVVSDFTAAFFFGMHFKVGPFPAFLNQFSSILAIETLEFEAVPSIANAQDLIADNSLPFSTISVDGVLTVTNGAAAGKYAGLFGSFQQATIRVFANIVLTASFDVTSNAMFIVEQFSFVTCPSRFIINPGNVVGKGASVTGQSIFDGDTATPMTYPGSVASFVDQTSSWAFKLVSGIADYQAVVYNLSAIPATSDLTTTGWGFFKDTSAGGRVGLYTNDAGIVLNLTPITSRVSSQFDKTNDAVLANIPGLTVNVAAGLTYEFHATLFTVSNVAGGVQAAIAGTCTATAIIYEGETTQSASISAQTRATALATAVGAVTAVTTARIDIDGLITVNAAGTLTVQFAQNVGNGTPSSVLVGSYFTVQQVE